jgi:hypothetical protein
MACALVVTVTVRPLTVAADAVRPLSNVNCEPFAITLPARMLRENVMRTLVARSGAISLSLDRLASPEVASFVEARCPAHAFPPQLVTVIETITAGTPLFLAAMLDDLIARGMLAQVDGVDVPSRGPRSRRIGPMWR